jgi:hypothetical protein
MKAHIKLTVYVSEYNFVGSKKRFVNSHIRGSSVIITTVSTVLFVQNNRCGVSVFIHSSEDSITCGNIFCNTRVLFVERPFSVAPGGEGRPHRGRSLSALIRRWC